MRYLLLAILCVFATSCASTYYDHDQWAKPNFKQSSEPIAPQPPAADITTPRDEPVPG
ncbi:MAG: hypothetical protein SGI88_16800 [Candidatus Hydrogenedentes bacterium]|nr:hypothetical protein [Candidatus Hydrogenedentota bacterium]